MTSAPPVRRADARTGRGLAAVFGALALGEGVGVKVGARCSIVAALVALVALVVTAWLSVAGAAYAGTDGGALG